MNKKVSMGQLNFFEPLDRLVKKGEAQHAGSKQKQGGSHCVG